MYTVIKRFNDLQDNNYAYNVGDTFPREGAQISEKRIDELSSNKNKRGTALIVKKKPKRKKADINA